MALFDDAAAVAAKRAGSNRLADIASGALRKYAPMVPQSPTEALSMLKSIAARRVSAILGPLSGLLSDLENGVPRQRKTPLTGGVSLVNAKEIFDKFSAIELARKNLFIVAVSPLSGMVPFGSDNYINLLATEVGYAPTTIQGDAVNIGSAVFDALKATERVEVRLTTYDDAMGSIKRFFETMAGKVAHEDGTFGLPIDYLCKIDIVHGVVSEDSTNFQISKRDRYICRPGQIEYSLSRREEGFQELQMTFTQWDTFSKIV
jgi:hypothetical protein